MFHNPIWKILPITLLSLAAQEITLEQEPVGFESGLGLDPLVKEEQRVAQPHVPGLNNKVKAFQHPDTVYDLYLPAAYTAQPESRFPLLLVHNPSGRPKISPYLDWAEQQGVIVVGLYKVSNGMKQHEKPRHWGALLKDLERKELRFQKGLLLTVGMSGGSADGERFTRSYPQYACGTIIMGVTLVPKGPKRSHIAAGLIIGGKDPFQGPTGRQKMWAAIEKDQIWVRPIYDLGRKHKTAPLSETLMLLDWMLELGRLRSPQLSEAQRNLQLERVLARMERIPKMEAGWERMQKIDHFLSMPPLTHSEAAENLKKLWAEDLALEASRNLYPEERALIRLDALASCSFLRLLAKEEAKEFRQEVLSTVDANFLKDWERFISLERQEWEAHLVKESLRKLDVDYQAFIQDTEYESLKKRAEQARERIRPFYKAKREP